MSAVSLVPKNGAIVYGSQICDYNAFTIRKSQAVENVTPYGTNTCTKNVGNGTPDFDLTIAAFALAHAANTPPILSTAAAAGVATTFTLDTGVTEVVTMVESSYEISHGRLRAAVPIAIHGKNAGDLVETWPVS